MYVLRPKFTKGLVPLVLTPHGHGWPHGYAGIFRNEVERKSMVEGDRDIAVQAVSEGYMAIVPTARGLGIRGLSVIDMTTGSIRVERSCCTDCSQAGHLLVSGCGTCSVSWIGPSRILKLIRQESRQQGIRVAGLQPFLLLLVIAEYRWLCQGVTFLPSKEVLGLRTLIIATACTFPAF